MADVRVNTFTTVSNATDGTFISGIMNGRIETESVVETNEDYSQLENAQPLPEMGEECSIREIYSDSDGVWLCIQNHTRTEHDPIDVPALFRQFKAQGEPWVQPIDQYDAYNIGDTCTFEGKLWASNINANVWSPTGYPAGWDEIIEESV